MCLYSIILLLLRIKIEKNRTALFKVMKILMKTLLPDACIIEVFLSSLPIGTRSTEEKQKRLAKLAEIQIYLILLLF